MIGIIAVIGRVTFEVVERNSRTLTFQIHWQNIIQEKSSDDILNKIIYWSNRQSYKAAVYYLVKTSASVIQVSV